MSNPSHNAIKLLLRDNPIPISISPLNKFINLLKRNSLTKIISNPNQILSSKIPLSIIVIHVEDLGQMGSSVFIRDFGSHEGEEFWEIEVSVAV